MQYLCYNLRDKRLGDGVNLLNINLKNGNISQINKNNIAYSSNFDKILFELDNASYEIKLANDFYLKKEDAEAIFILTKDKASYYLKEVAKELNIKVLFSSYQTKNNKHIITYQLESLEDINTLEIEMS